MAKKRRKPAKRDNDACTFDWSVTTWEGSRRALLDRWAEMTFDEILDAQEEMMEISRALAPRPQTDTEETE